MNISIYKPEKDLCDTFTGFNAGTVSESDHVEHIRKKKK
jgi:hypothetical protein